MIWLSIVAVRHYSSLFMYKLVVNPMCNEMLHEVGSTWHVAYKMECEDTSSKATAT